MKVVIVGAGAAGLFASLALARAGHEVVVLEQDRLARAPDVESAAASAFRPNAPQIVQPHIIAARCRELLLNRLPDVYDALIAAGVTEASLSTQMPDSLSDRSIWPGDERLTMLMARRSTLDWVLQRAVLAQPGVRVRCAVRVTGLLTVPGEPPQVTGVRTNHGDLAADLVLDAAGRRSGIDRWLGEIGARPRTSRWAECGLAYFSRHYRLRPRTTLPGLPTTRLVAGLDEFTIGIWGADNATMQMAVAPLAADRRFRTLKDPHVFTAVVRTVPTYAAWLDVLDPISPVYPMAGLHNTLRRLVIDGTPVVTGLHSIGDSVCTTNPTLSRGLSMALLEVADLFDVLGRHPDDRGAQALVLDALIGEHIAPFYDDQAAIDAARLATLRHTIFDTPDAPARHPPPLPNHRVTYAQLRSAAVVDPTAFRAFWKIQCMSCPPEEVYTDPHVVACTQNVLDHISSKALMAQLTREHLLAALAGHDAVSTSSNYSAASPTQSRS